MADHLAASRTWFDASLRALEASDYLRVHQGRAIQAIYVLLQVSLHLSSTLWLLLSDVGG